MLRGEITFDDGLFAGIGDTIVANKIGVAIFDPLIRAHLVPENDNVFMNAVMERLAHIADTNNTAVGIVHHIRKPQTNSESVTTIDDARGGGAIADDCAPAAPSIR